MSNATYHFIILKQANRRDSARLPTYSVPISMHYIGDRRAKRNLCRKYGTYASDSTMKDVNTLYTIKIFDADLNLAHIIPTDSIEEFQEAPMIIDYTSTKG